VTVALEAAVLAGRTEQPRDPTLERYVRDVAQSAAGLPAAPGGSSLDAYANQRAAPGGLWVPRHWKGDMREEIADAWNYGTWDLVQWTPGYYAGEHPACDEYDRTMRAMVCVRRAWEALNTPSS
jgi:hypothetical protein